MVLVERFDPAATLAPSRSTASPSARRAADVRRLARVRAPRGPPVASLRLAVSGRRAAAGPRAERFAEVTGVIIEEGYGLTEASPSVTSNSMAPEARPGVGRAAAARVELRLVDEDGGDVEVGDPGEVWVRGPNVFQGYWNDEATAASLTEDGWLRTGDVGTADEDGYLYLVDRKRDLIIVNGFNVYPREVERVLLEDEAVAGRPPWSAPAPAHRRDGRRLRGAARWGERRHRRARGPVPHEARPLQVPDADRRRRRPALHRDRQGPPRRRSGRRCWPSCRSWPRCSRRSRSRTGPCARRWGCWPGWSRTMRWSRSRG
jgi:acyl-CoA synthetase (AMP-forming)/AMP-acid ligase II